MISLSGKLGIEKILESDIDPFYAHSQLESQIQQFNIMSNWLK